MISCRKFHTARDIAKMEESIAYLGYAKSRLLESGETLLAMRVSRLIGEIEGEMKYSVRLVSSISGELL